ncbi:MAG: 50S ribosome-binding GTPase [Planctomycetales bacterium]|nr:50S ribosome-binding GTPase [Planctomycetales bacterium]
MSVQLGADDTIVAIASPASTLARGIVRISGPRVKDCLAGLFVTGAAEADDSAEGDADSAWRHTKVARWWEGTVRLPPPLGDIPAGMIFWPDSRSYTRQPAAELHLPGCSPLVDACLEEVCRRGARLAERGEFTLRAFLAGRIDLTQAEAVLGVIEAATEDELETALRQLAGNLAEPVAEARQSLISALAHLEAGLDFVDEDIEFIGHAELLETLSKCLEQVEHMLKQMERRAHGDGPPTVVFYGHPNSGKSSLFNAICGAQRALVSRQPGTTRDYLEAEVTIAGATVRLLDTAGLDPASVANGEESDIQSPGTQIDQLSQQLGSGQLQRAALRVLCVDRSRACTAWELAELRQADSRTLAVATKSDLPAHASRTGAAGDAALALGCSAVSGAGLEQLRTLIADRLGASGTRQEIVASTAARSRASLAQARDALRGALTAAESQLGEELVATELRVALDALGTVAGAVHHEEVLDHVFRQFCIGK